MENSKPESFVEKDEKVVEDVDTDLAKTKSVSIVCQNLKVFWEFNNHPRAVNNTEILKIQNYTLIHDTLLSKNGLARAGLKN